jgi:hypothetical protein
LSCAFLSDLDDAVDEDQDEGWKRGRPWYAHGSLVERPARALHTRAAFLNGRPSYLLYFWEVTDRHQLLQSDLQRLSDGTIPQSPILHSMPSKNRHPQVHCKCPSLAFVGAVERHVLA